MKHFKYLKYLVRHKYYVLLAGLQTKAPLFRLIIHDWSKFLPSEWFPYVNYFYGNFLDDESFKTCEKILGHYNPKYSKHYWNIRFKQAWLLHQRRNKHHWQFWCLRNDDGTTEYLDIPDTYIKEMVADWAGAGKAITGEWEVKEWYEKNKDKIKLSESTRIKVEKLVKEF